MPARCRPVQPGVIRPVERAPGNRWMLAPALRLDSRPKRRASAKPPLIAAFTIAAIGTLPPDARSTSPNERAAPPTNHRSDEREPRPAASNPSASNTRVML